MQLTTVENSIFTTEQWLEWIRENRCIALKVANDAGIRFSARGVTIPVYTPDGAFAFNKFRRPPWVNDGPKYSYEFGAKAHLYGAHLIKDEPVVVVCEGELDALVLRSYGYVAVSSTGGAGTFSPDWSSLFSGKKVVLLYDNDSAGAKGALRVVDILGGAYVAILPDKYGKDITDVVRSGNVQEVIECINRALYITNDWKNTLELLKRERVVYIQKYVISPSVLDLYIDAAHVYCEFTKKPTRKIDAKYKDKITHANAYPIEQLVKVNKLGFAKCVNGCKDKTPSMKVFKDNHVWSFCCGKRNDAIGIYRALNEVSFNEAVEWLTK